MELLNDKEIENILKSDVARKKGHPNGDIFGAVVDHLKVDFSGDHGPFPSDLAGVERLCEESFRAFSRWKFHAVQQIFKFGSAQRNLAVLELKGRHFLNPCLFHETLKFVPIESHVVLIKFQELFKGGPGKT